MTPPGQRLYRVGIMQHLIPALLAVLTVIMNPTVAAAPKPATVSRVLLDAGVADATLTPDAAPSARDAGPDAAPPMAAGSAAGSDAPSAVVPAAAGSAAPDATPSDITASGVASDTYRGIVTGNWFLVAGSLLSALILLIRWLLSRKWPKFESDRWGVLIAAGVSGIGALANVWIAGGSPDQHTLMGAVKVFAASTWAYVMAKKLGTAAIKSDAVNPAGGGPVATP